MPLAVGEFDRIPRPAVFLAFFAFNKESSDKLLFMLKRYNPAIANVNFSIARRQETPTGTHLEVRVSQADAAIIRANDGVFRFCMGESHFREFQPKSRARVGVTEVEIDEVDDDMVTISESELDEVLMEAHSNREPGNGPAADAQPVNLENGSALSSALGGADSQSVSSSSTMPPVNLEHVSTTSNTQGGVGAQAPVLSPAASTLDANAPEFNLSNLSHGSIADLEYSSSIPGGGGNAIGGNQSQ